MDTHSTAQGVVSVLAGTPLEQAAETTGMAPTELADAVEVYQAAGRAALDAQAHAHGWHQVRIRFTDWNTAEHTAATHLAPRLRQLKNSKTLANWWFIRKHPCWRLRCRPGSTTTLTDVHAAIATILDHLTEAGQVDRWWQTAAYEPEAIAFGGDEGMDLAHELFTADSIGILDYLHRHDRAEEPIGRRELSILLCSTLFHAAGQDWYEHGDIWHRVARLRPLPPDTPSDRWRDLATALQRLMITDTSPTSPLFTPGKPLAFATPWTTAFDQAGRRLAHTARDGTLQRGLRDVLAHHVIFHWNRLGLTDRTQGILARAARETVMNPPSAPSGSPGAPHTANC